MIRANRTRSGRCPACGEMHAACGAPSDIVPADERWEAAVVTSGPLRKYNFTSASGAQTVMKLNDGDAERYGLTDDDLVEAPVEPDAKAVTKAPNKARTSSPNKARAPRGKGGAGGGD